MAQGCPESMSPVNDSSLIQIWTYSLAMRLHINGIKQRIIEEDNAKA